jgi:UDP-glucose:(heptosyl)LPS alpha-1,3-glucosyltransferase
MKIALGIRDLSLSRGGAERYLVDLMQFLSQKGHEVHVFAYRFGEGLDGLSLHKVAFPNLPKGLRILLFARSCDRMIKRGNFDVIMGVGNTWRADLLQPHGGVHWKWFWRSLRAYENPWLWGAKLLGRILSPKQWAEGVVEDAPYRTGVKRIVAISEMVKEDIIDHYRIPEDRIIVVYNGVDTERFHPRNRRYREAIRKRYGLRAEDLVLLFVSHNFRLKGLRYLIQALPLIKREKEDIKLLVVGRDNNVPYQRLATKVGCGGDVVFAGGVSDLARYYPSADILVHPTFYDACSLVVLEALASGLPVITTRYNGAGWIISEGQDGCVLNDPRDVHHLAGKIIFLSQTDILKTASRAACDLARRFSRQRCYQAMLEVLQGLSV